MADNQNAGGAMQVSDATVQGQQTSQAGQGANPPVAEAGQPASGQPLQAATPPVGTGQEGAAQVSSPQAEPSAEQLPDLILADVLESERRNWQSDKDKEVAALNAKHQAELERVQAQLPQQQQQTRAPQPGSTERMSDADFTTLVNTDGPAALSLIRKENEAREGHIVDAVVSKLAEQRQNDALVQDHNTQYMAELQAMTQGYTTEEMTRVNAEVKASISELGVPLTKPYEAAMIGRYGSVEAAQQFAAQGFVAQQAQQQQQLGQNPGAAQQGQTPGNTPAFTPPPTGGAMGSTQTQTQAGATGAAPPGTQPALGNIGL